MSETRLGSRAVVRRIEPGTRERCPHCRKFVMFEVWKGGRAQKVIANVYVRGRWDRIEHYHEACYTAAGEPYGPAR